MLGHLFGSPSPPKRVALLGATGFVSGEIRKVLDQEKVECLAVGSRQVDLIDSAAAEQLSGMLHPQDVLIFVSALTPDKGRDPATLMKNVRMAENVCSFLRKSGCAHVIYISSDAVYDSRSPLLSETSSCEPGDLYALAHTTREKLLAEACQKSGIPLALLRPCSIYGARDTHNSYGPNRFVRSAMKEGRISLFGHGEERRDHVFIEDVGEVILRCVGRRSAGVLNLASGHARSFLDVAGIVAASMKRNVSIEELPRSSPVIHRHFDITGLIRAFPDFRPVPLDIGIARMVQEMGANPGTLTTPSFGRRG